MPPGSTSILLITRNLPPLVGGMERLLHEAALGMADYAELTVIGPRGCEKSLPDTVRVHTAPAGLAGFLLVALVHVLRLARRRRFDVVVGGSGLVAPLLLLASRLAGAPCVVMLHGLDLVVNSAIYQRFFVPCITRVDRVIANSRNTAELALRKGVQAQRIDVIFPGTELPGPVEHTALADFRQRHGIRFERYLLFAGRLTRRKGLSRFLRDCLRDILAQQPGLGLVVVGDDPRQSLDGRGDHAATLAAVKELGLDDAIQFIGSVSNADMWLAFAGAQIHIFPLVEIPGDVEGFGMVAVEAAAAGTPTVAYDLGGVADAISALSGRLVAAGDSGGFTRAVLEELATPATSAEDCRRHAMSFSWEHYNRRLKDSLDAVGRDAGHAGGAENRGR